MTTSQRSTVVGVFERQEQAEQAVQDLRQAGFSADQLGFAGHDKQAQGPGGEQAENIAKGAASGLIPGGVIGGVIGAVATGLIPGVGPIISAGILAGTVGGAAAGAATGGLVGALTGAGVSEDEARYYEDEFKAGRTLVTVKANGRYDEASAILRRDGAHDIDSRGESPSGQAQRASSEGVQLREEELRARTEQVQTGEARVAKDVVQEERTIEVPRTREDVSIERRPVEGRPAASGDVGSGEEVRVPLREDQVRVEKEPVVREEVEIKKEPVQETERVQETVRREEPRIERQDR
jgi:uncharacterized protein (TIGR02271 family)